ncbi:membrane protein [Neorhizobium sp. NCHU2750]|nr:membrane protein [Neorhizobium sp. NCHU2750]
MADESANFGMLTAIVMVPLIGAAGLAIDFGRALELKTELAAAADAAAVGAVAEKSTAVTQAMAAGNGTVSLDDAEARKLFFGQVSANSIDAPVNVAIQLQKVNNIITSRVTYTATLPTTFMQVLGKTEITVSNVATAQYQTPSFLDFYMLLDNTPSMGVGATPDDIKKLVAATVKGTDGKGKDGSCAFACHIVSTTGVVDYNSYYYLAKSIGATIRIDVVADAVSALMKTATDSQLVSGQFRMAAYTFGKTALDAQLYTVANPTTDFASVSKATEAIELMSIPSHDYPNNQTNYDDALQKINSKITSTGGGTSVSDRQAIVFLVADGVGDAARSSCQKKLDNTSSGPRCMEPINTQYCDTLKARGIKIAVLYTTYVPLTDNSFYNTWIKPFQSEIPTKMQACATEGYYFEVSPTEGIADAMKALFRKIVATPRITS